MKFWINYYLADMSTGEFTKPFTHEVSKSPGLERMRSSILERCRKNPKMRMLIIGYILIAFGYFVMRTYNDGHAALCKYNDVGQRSISVATSEGRFKAVKEGCTHNAVSNFFNSVFFPWTIITDTMPHAIIWLDGYD